MNYNERNPRSASSPPKRPSAQTAQNTTTGERRSAAYRPTAQRPAEKQSDAARKTKEAPQKSSRTAEEKTTPRRTQPFSGTEKKASGNPSATEKGPEKKEMPRSGKQSAAPAGGVAPARSGTPAKQTAGKPAKRQVEVEALKPADLIISRGPVDRPLLIIIIVMLCFGVVMVFSASYAAALNEKGTSYYYIIRHIAYIGLGAGIAFLEMAILKYRFDILRKSAFLIYLIGLGLLAFVLVNGYARGVAKRWIFIGSFSFQPSEFMKLALVLFLAAYLSKNQKKILAKRFWYSSWFGDFIPIFIVAVPCLLIFLENHLSGTIITCLIGLFVIWAAGSNKTWFLVALLLGTVVFLYAINYIDYVHVRWDAFVHPENYDPTDELWQSIQGQIAVGSGGWFGVGLGNSRQKHMFVSQPQNDFIFSIICEELGFIGALFVIALFLAFTVRGITVALRAPDTFSCLTAIGITSQIGLQAVLNMMVVVGVIPNTGISLPFFSYGGSSILMLMIEMGILLSISRFSYQKE